MLFNVPPTSFQHDSVREPDVPPYSNKLLLENLILKIIQIVSSSIVWCAERNEEEIFPVQLDCDRKLKQLNRKGNPENPKCCYRPDNKLSACVSSVVYLSPLIEIIRLLKWSIQREQMHHFDCALPLALELVINYGLQKRNSTPLFLSKKQSWEFLFGDPIS